MNESNEQTIILNRNYSDGFLNLNCLREFRQVMKSLNKRENHDK